MIDKKIPPQRVLFKPAAPPHQPRRSSVQTDARTILEFLAAHAGQVVTAERLVEHVRTKSDSDPTVRSIRYAVRRLRHRIEQDPKQPRLVRSVPNGYVFGLDRTQAGSGGELSAQQVTVLTYLLSHPGVVISKDKLLERLSTEGHPATPASLRAAIRRVRSEINPDPDRPQFLVTVRGLGYQFNPRGAKDKRLSQLLPDK